MPLKSNLELTPGTAELSLKTFSAPGRVTFNVQPQLGSITTLSLFGQRSAQSLLAEISISDENCEAGFMIKASSSKGPDHNFVYFDDPVAWGKPIAITLMWATDRQLYITVAGEKKSLTLKHQPHRVAVNVLRGSTQIDRFSFEPKPKEGL